MKNWSIGSNQNGFTPPELSGFWLQGNVYGHPGFEDGKYVHTSRIIGILEQDGCKIVKTRNSEYMVHREGVDPRAEDEFPNYYGRLQIKEIS